MESVLPSVTDPPRLGGYGNHSGGGGGGGGPGGPNGHVPSALLGVCLGLLSLLTVTMNLLVLYAVRREKSLHTVGNLYIVSLSVADLVVGATVMPLNLVYLLEDEWRLGRAVCQFWLIADYVASTASIFSLFILCLDRYRSVRQPLRYLKYRTRGKASLMISGAWLLSMMWIIPILGWRSFAHVDLKPEEENQCDTDFRFVTWFKVVTAVFNFYVPSVMMLWFYTHIYLAVRQHLRDRERIIHPSDSFGENENGRVDQSPTKTARKSPKRETAGSERLSKKERLLDQNTLDQNTLDQNTLDQNTLDRNTLDQNTLDRNTLDRNTLDRNTLDQALSLNDADRAKCGAWRTRRKIGVRCPQTSLLSVTAQRLGMSQKPQRSSASPDDQPPAAEPPPSQPAAAPEQVYPAGGSDNKLQASLNECHVTVPNSVGGVCDISQVTDMRGYASALRGSYDPGRAPPWPDEEADGVRLDPGNPATLKQAWQKFLDQSCRRLQSLRIRKEHKAARQLGFIIAAFLLCWIPYFIAFTVTAFCRDCVHHDLHMFTIWLGYVNSTLNPFIYPLCNGNFKRVFRSILNIQL